MSTSKDINDSKVSLKKLPLFLIKKKELRQFKPSDFKSGLFKEDILYESRKGDFLNSGTTLKLVNRFNLITKSSVTVAISGESTQERTSENISRLIGQSNYDTVFSALCSVINYELKIRGILSLLTHPKKTHTVSCQTGDSKTNNDLNLAPKTPEQVLVTANKVDQMCQTEESFINHLSNTNKRIKRTRRKQFKPYVVTEASDKKTKVTVLISPNSFKDTSSNKMEVKNSSSIGQIISASQETHMKPLPVLDKLLIDDNSNDSKFSMATCSSIPALMSNPYTLIDNDIPVSNKPMSFDWSDNTEITLLDGTIIQIPFKVEDEFHIAIPEIMNVIPPEQHGKLLCYQAYLDWKNCLIPDDEHHLPIHVAAMNEDVNLLKRQCLVLQARGESVDTLTKENLSALHISIFSNKPQCTEVLLQFGADVLVTDDEYRTSFHLAAEADPEHLRVLIKHCQANPMKILQDNIEMWQPEFATKPANYLYKCLMRKISTMFDDQGYTPLMLASKLGKDQNVKLLLETCSDAVNVQMPSSGNTALYLAIGSAYLEANSRGNISAVSENFKNTIEYLVELGADPAIENHSGSSCNSVLTDLRINTLSMIVANKMTAKNWMEADKASDISNPSHVGILLKDKDGKLNYKVLPTKKIQNEKTKDKNDDTLNDEGILIKGTQNQKTINQVEDGKLCHEEESSGKMQSKNVLNTDKDSECNYEKVPKMRTQNTDTLQPPVKSTPTILEDIQIQNCDPILAHINLREFRRVKEIKSTKNKVISPSSSTSENVEVVDVPCLNSVTVENKVLKFNANYMDSFKNFVAGGGATFKSIVIDPSTVSNETITKTNAAREENITSKKSNKANVSKKSDNSANVTASNVNITNIEVIETNTRSSIKTKVQRKRSLLNTKAKCRDNEIKGTSSKKKRS